MKQARLEVFGSLLDGFAQACINLGIVAGLEAKELVSNINPSEWYPLEHFYKVQQFILQYYDDSSEILETVGTTMMNGWYHHGPGKDLVIDGPDFLKFQSGSDGYLSVIRGPNEIVGRFELLYIDRENGTAKIHSTTPFDRDLERGVILGGVSAPGDVDFITVENQSESDDIFNIRYHQSDPVLIQSIKSSFAKESAESLDFDNKANKTLHWMYKSLEQKFEKGNRFWQATNKSLSKAYQKIETQSEETSEVFYKAGMADAISDVMHHVGNSINSLSTSTDFLRRINRHSKAKEIKRINELLLEHSDNLAEFLTEDDKGVKIIDYFKIITESLEDEVTKSSSELSRVSEGLEEIRKYLVTQQVFAEAKNLNEEFNLIDVIEGVLRMQSGFLRKNQIRIEKSYADDTLLAVCGHKSKLISVLIEICKNSADAMKSVTKRERVFKVDPSRHKDRVVLQISDTGTGIPKKDIAKVFSQGFTTKQNRHGFGLHNCANYISQMGGTIEISETQRNKGTTVTITFQS